MKTLFQKIVRAWREEHPLIRAGAVLFLLCSLAQAFLDPAFKNAVADPARSTPAQTSYALRVYTVLVGVMTLQMVGLVLVGIGTSIKIRQRKQARQTPWWRDR